MKKAVKKKVAKPVDTIKKFGYFNDKTNEFVVTTPLTPRSWENILWNGQIDIHISNHGTGSSTKLNTNGKPSYFNLCHVNRVLYVYDRKEKDLWCPNWFPVNAKLDSYEVRHGLQCTVFKASRNDIEISWSVTVHHTDAAEIWRVDVRNLGRKEKDILLVPFYQADPGIKNFDFGSPNRYSSFVSKKSNCIYMKNDFFNRKDGNVTICDGVGFHADRKFSKYEMNMEYFLKGYTALASPGTILKNEWTSSFIDGDEHACLAAGFDLAFKKDQTHQINMEIFAAESLEEAEKISASYMEENIFETSMKKHAEETDRIISINNVKTMNSAFDRYVNVWIKHQLRHDALQSWGSESGFQGVMSDGDMFRIFDPLFVRAQILLAASYVCEDGKTDALSGGGVWFQNTLCQYVRETGDRTILNEEVPFFMSEGKGTVLGHLKLTVAFMDKQRGPDNICRGSTNHQSIPITMAAIFGLKNSSSLLKMIRDPDAEIYAHRAKELSDILNSKFFEDDRYVFAVTDDGRSIGSKQNEKGKMWIEPQAWSLISGIADHEKTAKIVEAMRKELYTPYGVMCISPAFKKYTEAAGRISNEILGTASNGSIDLQEMFFYTYGLTQVDRADEAYDLLNRVLPTNPKNPPEVAMAGPFQIPAAFHGPDSRYPGRAMADRRTGSAGLFLKTVWDGMIGICPDFDCIKVNARLPKAFGDRIELTRVIRGRSIRFEIAKQGYESKDAAFTMRVKNGVDISYKDISDDEFILVLI